MKTGLTFYSGHGGCLTRLIVLSIAVMLGAWLLPGVEVSSLLDNLVRPILIVVTLPVTAITLGLFLFVINAVILVMASAIVDGFDIGGFGSALLLSLVITVVNYLLELPNRYLQREDMPDKRRSDDDSDDDGFTPYEEIKD